MADTPRDAVGKALPRDAVGKALPRDAVGKALPKVGSKRPRTEDDGETDLPPAKKVEILNETIHQLLKTIEKLNRRMGSLELAYVSLHSSDHKHRGEIQNLKELITSKPIPIYMTPYPFGNPFGMMQPHVQPQVPAVASVPAIAPKTVLTKNVSFKPATVSKRNYSASGAGRSGFSSKAAP